MKKALIAGLYATACVAMLPATASAQASGPDECEVMIYGPAGAPKTATPAPTPATGTKPGATTPGTTTPGTTAPAKPGTTTPKPGTTPPTKPAPATGNPNVAMPTGSATKCNQGISMSRSNQAAIQRAKAAKATLQAAASRHGIDWRMLAAIGVRETNFMSINNPDPNDPGMGVFQLTRQPGVTPAQAHNLAFAADRAARIVKSDMATIRRRFPKFTQAQVLQAAFAAYNFGVDDISGNPATIDKGTTRNNYGQNILLLMNCF